MPVNDVQFLNAPYISVPVDKAGAVVNPVHPWKAHLKFEAYLGIVYPLKSFNDVQFINVQFRFTTESGRTGRASSVSDVQPLNVEYIPFNFVQWFIVGTFFNEVHPINVPPKSVTVLGITTPLASTSAVQ